MNAETYIKDALTEIGVTMPGADVDAGTLTWGLRKLNRMLDSMSADGLNLYKKTHENFPTIAGTPNYTIGPAGTINAARPTVIETAYVQDAAGESTPISVRPIHEYWLLSNRATEGEPVSLYLDSTTPLSTIYLHYSPSTIYDVHIVSQKPLDTPATLATEVVLPPEYEEMLITKLSIRLAARYGIRISPELAVTSKETYSTMLARNLANTMKPVAISITGNRTTYNIEAG